MDSKPRVINAKFHPSKTTTITWGSLVLTNRIEMFLCAGVG